MHLEGCIHSVHLERWIHGVHFRGMDTQCALGGMDTQCAFKGMDTLCTFGVSVNFRGVDTIDSVHFSLEGWIHSVNFIRTFRRGRRTVCM